MFEYKVIGTEVEFNYEFKCNSGKCSVNLQVLPSETY